MSTEPVLTVVSISAAIVAAAGLLGIAIDLNAVTAVVVVGFAVVSSLIARSKVTPV